VRPGAVGGTERFRATPDFRADAVTRTAMPTEPYSVVARHRDLPVTRPTADQLLDEGRHDIRHRPRPVHEGGRRDTYRAAAAGSPPGLASSIPMSRPDSRGGRRGIRGTRDRWMRPRPPGSPSTVSGSPSRTGGGVAPLPRRPAAHRRAAVPPHLSFARKLRLGGNRVVLARRSAVSQRADNDVVTPTAGSLHTGQSGLDHP
jgi:hypothetical protein